MYETEEGKYKKAQCPHCGEKINFATIHDVDYDLRCVDSRVRCKKCGRYIYFSLKKDNKTTK